jgi:hypothetical protein
MYKKLLLLTFAVVTIQAAKAQTEKGSQNRGATFQVSTSTSNSRSFNQVTNSYGDNSKGKATTYGISPNYSYFIADKLDLGASLGYSHYLQTYSPDANSIGNTKANDFNASIALRKYYLFDDKVGIRTGPYVSYDRIRRTYTYTSSQNVDNLDIYSGGIQVDFVYYPTKKIGVAAGLGNLSYTHQKIAGFNDGSQNTFNLSFVNSLALSVYYVFGK